MPPSGGRAFIAASMQALPGSSATEACSIRQLFDLDIDPANPSVLYASTWSGVFRSADAGANWIKLDSPSRTSELAIDPANSDRLIVVTEGNGIARSEDAGQTWTAINAGLNGVTQFLSVAIGPQGSGTVYAGSFREGLFISNDYGDNWSLLGGSVSGSEPPSTPSSCDTAARHDAAAEPHDAVDPGQQSHRP